MDDLCIFILNGTERSRKILKRVLNALDITPRGFFEITRHAAIPYLFMKGNVDLLEDVAQFMQKNVPALLIEECGYIFGYLLLKGSCRIENDFGQFISLTNLDSEKITIGQIFKSSLLTLTGVLVEGLGSKDASERKEV